MRIFNLTMKHLKQFENFTEETPQETTITNPNKIDGYPVSVRTIFNRFSQLQKQAIEGDLPQFAKAVKPFYYMPNKSWKLYFNNKDYKKLTSLSQIIDSIGSWMKKNEKV